MDDGTVEVYDVARRNERAFRVDLTYQDEETDGEFTINETYLITPSKGTLQIPLRRPTPLDFPEYEELYTTLGRVIYSSEDGERVVNRLEAEGKLSDVDEYLRRAFMSRRRKVGEFLWSALCFYGAHSLYRPQYYRNLLQSNR